jgi:hypothetical protein
MATYDKTGGNPNAGTIPYRGENRVYVIENTVDLTAVSTLAAADIYQCLAIPANTLVMQVVVQMITAAIGTTLTATVGDGAGATSWDASEDHKGTALTTWYSSAVGTDTYAVAAAMGKFYAAADSIDVTYSVVTAITAGPKFKIFALCVDYN